MENNLILVGGGGHCKSVIEAAESAGWNIRGILDLPEKVGGEILGYSVVGTDEDIPAWVGKGYFVVTVGHIKDPEPRIGLHEKIRTAGGIMATVVASSARVSRNAHVGEGSVILHQAVVNAHASVGRGCIVNTFADIEHDAVIGDFCHISTGAIVNGNCSVGDHTFLGSASVMANGTSIVPGCVVSAGSVVRKSLRKKGVYAGNPALLKITL